MESRGILFSIVGEIRWRSLTRAAKICESPIIK